MLATWVLKDWQSSNRINFRLASGFINYLLIDEVRVQEHAGEAWNHEKRTDYVPRSPLTATSVHFVT